MTGTKKIIWEPIPERSESSGIRRYMDWLRENKALSFDDYHSLWGWSVANIDDFWESMWQYYGIKAHKEYSAVRNGLGMPNTRFF
ncbi:MAG: acetoacetate--CoA ligase, partial [Actinobacteria bacterium]|nr:acetoacetate--CoA ligase [Actinomycetota bacterium]